MQDVIVSHMSPERMNPKQRLRHAWGRYIVALVLVACAASLRVWPLQGLESSLAWLTFYPAVTAVALYGGLFAGLLATVLACLTVTFLWPLLIGQPFIRNRFDLLGMAVFALTGMMISCIVEMMHRANARAKEAQKQAEATALASVESEQFIKSVINAMPNMIGYWDKELRFRFVNDAYREWFGKAPEAIIGTAIRDLMGERLFALNEAHILGALAGEQQQFQRTLTKADGSAGYILGNYIPDIDANGTVTGIFILASDVTELKEAQAQLELAASVFENTVEGITVTNAQGIILSVNRAFTEITGYEAEEAIGQTPRILKSHRHDQAFYVAMWQEITAKDRWKGDIWNRRKDGEVYLERITITMIRDAFGEPIRYVSVFNDITDLWHKDEYLRHLAFHDALTDLPNRSLLMERLDQQIATAKREQFGMALMFLDLDRFKFVNDNFGHNVGDDLLRAVAQKLLTLVRQSDTVARLGGDEFVIQLRNPANKAEIADIAHRIISVINEPMEFRGNAVQVGTSIGIAIFPADGHTAVDLIKNADAAMYAAKDAGKNTFRFYEPTAAAHIIR
jgi:diguanylate cyclase (GGDEF)-like protein/PAS domain S-box-containing protein